MLTTIWTVFVYAMGYFFISLVHVAMFFAQFGIAGFVALLLISVSTLAGLAALAARY